MYKNEGFYVINPEKKIFPIILGNLEEIKKNIIFQL